MKYYQGNAEREKELDTIVMQWRGYPPLCENDLDHWVELARCDSVSLDESILQKYNAVLLMELTRRNEERSEKSEQAKNWYDKWRQSDEYKDIKKKHDVWTKTEQNTELIQECEKTIKDMQDLIKTLKSNS